MSDRETKPAASPQKGRQIAGLGMWIVVLTALPFIANRWWNHPGMLIGLACFYIVTAFVLGSRLVICTLAGIVLGFMFDNGVRGGSHESQMWETVGRLVMGVIIGISIGLLWDFAAHQTEDAREPKKKKR